MSASPSRVYTRRGVGPPLGIVYARRTTPTRQRFGPFLGREAPWCPYPLSEALHVDTARLISSLPPPLGGLALPALHTSLAQLSEFIRIAEETGDAVLAFPHALKSSQVGVDSAEVGAGREVRSDLEVPRD